MKILFINNRDSFVWNLVDYVSIFESDTVVVPNTISSKEVEDIGPDAIVISPGPGNPHSSRDIGNCIDIIQMCAERGIPVLGVCLGHQAINVAFGGTVGHSKSGPVHGKASPIIHDPSSLFAGMPDPFPGGRYHSLAIEELSPELEVTARTEDDIIMGVQHRRHPVYGIQFHPESVLTPDGLKLIENFLKIAGSMYKN